MKSRRGSTRLRAKKKLGEGKSLSLPDASKVLLTSFSGLPLVMETFRTLRLPQSIQKHLPLLQRQGKYQEADDAESFVSIFAGGGDCVDDSELLRGDEGFSTLLSGNKKF